MYRNGFISIVMAMAALGACIGTVAGETAGQDARAPHMAVFGEALPPLGYVGFCQRHAEDCRPDPMRFTPAAFVPGDMRELKAVNDLVNRTVKPATDLELYGVVEYWAYPAGKGDCEDYVLLKRRILAERGWPQAALLITVVRDELGEGHAVLTVRTEQGDVILDNKHNEILLWSDTPYTFVKRQSQADPRLWLSLAPPGEPQAARVSGTRTRH